VVPIFEYRTESKFRLIEGFEGGNSFSFDEDGDLSTFLDVTNLMASEGLKSGLINLSSGAILEQGSTLIYNGLPKNGSPIYVEIDYKGDLDLDFGLIGVQAEQMFKDYFVSLRSDINWKKTYINLTSLVEASNLEGYQLLIGADNSSGDGEIQIYVDNIKFLHF
jgi:hypothetical protein